MVGEYPYFQTARLLYLHNLFVMHDESFGEELKQAALCVTDRNLIFQFVEGANYKIKPRTMGSNGQPSLDRTLSLIDDFLSQIPHEKSEAAHHDSHALSAADATDYTSYLLSLDDISDEEQQEAAAEVQPMRVAA